MARTWKPSIVEYDKCNRLARRDGIFAGTTGGLFAALFGQRALKFDRKKALFSGLLAAALSGYFFSQAFLTSHLAQLERDALQRAALANTDSKDEVKGEHT